MKRNVTFQSKRAQIRITRLLELLEGRMLPTATIAKDLYCDTSLVSDYLRYLRTGPERRVRVAGYEVVNGSKRALYGLGSEPDEPMTTQTSQERYAAVKANPKRLERRRELRRESYDRCRARMPRQRDRRKYDPPLDQQILALVEKMPGYTTEQIAYRLDANLKAVTTTMRAMSKTGVVRRALASTMKAYQWETPDRPMAAVPKVAPQTIFSALGV